LTAVKLGVATVFVYARKGSDVLSEVLAEDSGATRIGLSAAAHKAAENVSEDAWLNGYQTRSGASARHSEFKRPAQLGKRQPNTVHTKRAQD